jgi:ACS family tartrate transporter-like MFS transporter
MSAAALSPAATSVESTTIRKVRWRLLPYIGLLYVIAYVDRVNVSYAELDMKKDLAIKAAAYGLVAAIFFIGYFLFEIPSNVILHRVGARKWMARILVSWGIIAAATGFVHGVGQLYAARFLLGVAEAGFFPGMVLYLTYWFRAREQARAFAFFMLAQPIAFIVGAPTGGFILDHVHWAGLQGWRWVFILQGIPAVILGIVTFFYLTDRPRHAHWLSGEERDWLEGEIGREREEKQRKHQISQWQALRNPRVLHLTAIYFTIVLGFYGLNFFLPTIIKQIDPKYSNTNVGLMAMIPYIVGGVAMVLNGWHSDRTLERKYHTIACTVISAIGLVGVAAFRHNAPLAIAFLCVVAIGNFGYIAPFWALPALFLSEASAAVGIALINSFGNLGGFFGPYIVGQKASETNATKGLFILAASFLAATVLLTLLRAEPLKAAKEEREVTAGLGRRPPRQRSAQST